MLQFFFLYLIFFFFFSNNLFYCLFYFFSLIILFGCVLCIEQLDFFTGFLWVIEFTVVFVSIIFLYYLNIACVFIYPNSWGGRFFGFILFFLFLFFFFFLVVELEGFLGVFFNCNYIYSDYYGGLYCISINDFFGLFVGYYLLNGLLILVLGFLLLIASIVCVYLNIFQHLNSFFFLVSGVCIFDFLYSLVSFKFLRSQNLINQNNSFVVLRSFISNNNE